MPAGVSKFLTTSDLPDSCALHNPSIGQELKEVKDVNNWNALFVASVVKPIDKPIVCADHVSRVRGEAHQVG